MAEVIFVPEAAQDLGEAYMWYEQQRPGLGEDFLSCVEACVRQIVRNPRINAQVHKQYRRAIVRRFPYCIFYDHTDEQVMIYCVLHSSRSPDRWRERLP